MTVFHRREFLQGVSAAAALSAAGPLAFGSTGGPESTTVKRVIVIGAGIVGASIAYNLSKRGCEVVVLEKRAPASQASGNSFAWINASWFDQPDSYLNLRTHSLNEWHRLAQEVDIPIHWGGSLEWSANEQGTIDMINGIARTQASGVPAWIVTGNQAMDIEPNLQVAADQRIAWSSRDGAVDSAGVTWALLRQVSVNGGQVVYPSTVSAIEFHPDGAVVTTNADSYSADLVVSATGAGTSSIAAMIGLSADPMRNSTPGIIVTTEPMERIVNTVVYNHQTHFHQLPDGRLLVGEKAGAPQTDQHRALLSERPNVYPDSALADEHARRVFETAARYMPKISDAKAASIGVGWRPLPKDGLPIVGRVEGQPGLYLAAMHSGVTLAPIVGHLAAMEILDGVRVSLLDDFRYERF